jgi:hypothetical protein
MELVALCKKYAEDAQKLKEKTKLEGMVESRDELIMEFIDKYGYNHSDEDADDEDEDDDDGRDTATPPAAANVPPPAPVPPTAALEEIAINEEDPVEMAPEAHDVILVDAELELLQPRLFNVIMRDYEESPSRMMDGPHELDDMDDPIEVDYGVDEWFPMDRSNDWD